MKSIRLILLVSFLVVLAVPSGLCGRLNDRLTETLQQKSPDEYVSVWITLKDNSRDAATKSSIAVQAATRAERHRLTLNRLKSKASDQAALLERLEELKDLNRAHDIKGHWIVNLVEAKVSAGELESLAERSDIDIIYQTPEVQLIKPVIDRNSGRSASGTGSIEANLVHVNAPEAWAQGYTGKGRLVCSFDNGILGSHPALEHSWKGQDGDSAAAWFDPIGQEPFPHLLPVPSQGHGTHVMGIMVGRDDSTGDTVGVAPDAKWISAGVIELQNISLFDAFEWAADPDDNPNTVSDVPDVINHSWGIRGVPCMDAYYDAIDNTEALGIVNIFAAGNSPQMYIWNPMDRALDSIDCFAVGNLNHTVTPPEISGSSALGPSPCDTTKIKPNVVAPGTNIRSTWINGNYDLLSGTSMAAPHVSGLVALLRQKNPDATVAEIKTTILNTTQRADFGTIPNDTVGWGEIDCLAALEALPAGSTLSPSVRVYDFVHDPILPGDTVIGTVVLQNRGGDAYNVIGEITGSDGVLLTLDRSVTFGTIVHGDTVESSTPVRVVVADTVTEGSIHSLDFTINVDGFSSVPAKLYFLVEPPRHKGIVTHNVGRTEFSLSNYGVLGLGPGSVLQLGGAGFEFDDGGNDLFEGGIMVGNSITRVSSSVHNQTIEPDMDFEVGPNGNITLIDPGVLAAQESHAILNDSNATNPLGLEIIQDSYAFASPDDDYIIVRYILNNISGSALSDILFGLHLDWDLPSVGFMKNAGGYDSDGDFAWMAYNAGIEGNPVLSRFRGVRLVQGDLATAGAMPGSEIWAVDCSPTGDGYHTYEKYNFLSSGMLHADENKAASSELFLLMAAGSMSLPAGGRDTVAFAILAGETFADMQDVAFRAGEWYTDVEEPDAQDLLPSQFVLHQNYPNPFNPSTQITFEMPRAGEYALTIVNMLGQTVHRQTGHARAGTISIDWDGQVYASGVYVYRVTVDNQTASRKMLLLK